MAIQNITDGCMDKVDVKGTEDSFILRVQDKIGGETVSTTVTSLDKAEAEKLAQALAEWIATQP